MKLFILLLISILSFSSFAADEAFENFNFGQVVKNENFTLYRSGRLGKKGIDFLYQSYFKKNSLPLPKTVIYMNDEGYNDRFIDIYMTKGDPLFAIDEFNLQSTYNYKFYHSYDYAQRTYLDGRNPAQPEKDIDRSGNLGKEAIRLFGGDPKDGLDGGVEAFYRILDLVLDSNNGPVLFHCNGGFHRTGMIALAIRYIQGGKWLETPAGQKLNNAQLEYNYYNVDFRRAENLAFIESISKTEKFKTYISKYRDLLN